MNKTFFFLLIIILSTACNSETTAKFEITNASSENVDSLYILPDKSKNNFLQMTPGSKALYEIDMTGIAKTDGYYLLSFKLKGKPVVMPFGYFSNGAPLESVTRIFIHSDTVIIKPQYKN